MAQAKGRKPWPGKPFGTQSINESRAEVVAQLVEWLLPTPEIHGSNLNIDKVLSTNCNLNRKDKNKEKEARNGPTFIQSINESINLRFNQQICTETRKIKQINPEFLLAQPSLANLTIVELRLCAKGYLFSV